MLKEYSEKLLQIYHQDWQKIVSLCILNFIVITITTFGISISTALFLKHVGINFLPQMYLVNGLLIFLSTFGLFMIANINRTELLIKLSMLFGITVLAIRVFIVFDVKFLYIMLYVLSSIIFWLFYTQFWSLAVDICNVREGKRIFSLVVCSGLLGGGTAGLLIQTLAKTIRTDNLLVLWSIMFFILSYFVKSKFSSSPHLKTDSGVTSQVTETITYFKESHIIKVLMANFLLYAVVIYFLDFQFNKIVNQTFTELDSLTSFYGTYSICFYTTTLFIQLIFANRILKYFGTGNVIVGFPVSLFIGFSALVIKFGYISALFAKFIRDVMGNSIIDSAYPLLYSPIKDKHRDNTLAFIEGVAIPAGTVLAGFLLIILKSTPGMYLTVFSLILSLLWLYCSVQLKYSYQSAFIQNIAEKTLPEIHQLPEHLTDLNKKRTLAILYDAIRDKNDKVSLFAISTLGKTKDTKALNPLISYLKENPPAVRRASIIKALGEIKETNSLLIVSRYLEDPESRVRANAVESLGEIGGSEVKDLIKPYINDKDSRVAINAGMILWKYGDKELGIKVLRELLSFPNEQTRIRAIYAMGQIDTEEVVTPLLEVSKEQNLRIRLEALKSLSKFNTEVAILRIIDAIEDTDRRIRQLALKTLIEKKGITGLLVKKLETANSKIIEKIIEILANKHEQDEIILNHLKDEIKKVYQRIVWVKALSSEDRTDGLDLFISTLLIENRKKTDRILKLMSKIERVDILPLIIRRLKDKSADIQAEIVEILDSLQFKHIGIIKLLIPVLEETPKEEILKIANREFGLVQTYPREVYKEILKKENGEWFKGCVLHILGEKELDKFLQDMINYTKHNSEFLREMSLEAISKINIIRAKLIARGMLNDNSPQVKAFAKSISGVI